MRVQLFQNLVGPLIIIVYYLTLCIFYLLDRLFNKLIESHILLYITGISTCNSVQLRVRLSSTK